MKTFRFIMTMKAAIMLAVFSISCGLAPDLTLSAATEAAREPYPPPAAITPLSLKEAYPPYAPPPAEPTIPPYVPPAESTIIEPVMPTATSTAAPTMIERATATPIPASWETFSDSTLKILFRYPAEWQDKGPLQLSGTDGFVDVSLLDYHASSFDIVRTLCVLEANTGRPAAYGAGPLIFDWQGWDTERQTSVGRGCFVMPSDGMPPDGMAQGVLFAHYPSPQQPDKLLVLRADAAHFTGILSTLRFHDYTPPAPSSGYYNSPACDEAKVGLPQVVLRTEALVITETAIANQNCHPMRHFDGFQNLVRNSGVQDVRNSAYENDRAPSGKWGKTARVGDDLMGFEYASSPLFPVGAPSQIHITKNGQVVDILAVPHAGAAGYPVVGFWGWNGHWVLEMESVVVQDGLLLNNTLNYAEIFEWNLMNDEPFYFFQKDSSYGISYAGQELPLRYDDIIHGQMCCETGVYHVISTPFGAYFYALKGDVWYMVQAELK